jgi:hypothetical protein
VTTPPVENDLALLDRLAEARRELAAQIGKRIVGQTQVVDDLVTALLAGGHIVLVGVPGLAKTLLVQTVAQALDLTFSRVQFTADLMPSDLSGVSVYERAKESFVFHPGPIFAQVLLADDSGDLGNVEIITLGAASDRGNKVIVGPHAFLCNHHPGITGARQGIAHVRLADLGVFHRVLDGRRLDERLVDRIVDALWIRHHAIS